MQLPHFPRHTEIVEGNGVQTTRFADWMLLLFTAVNKLIDGIVDSITTGAITAATLTLSGLLTGVTAAFSGAVSALTLTLTGGQIVFPATQNPSTDANTLDDYEEDLAVVPTSPNITYAANSFLNFQKVGPFVHVVGRIVFPATADVNQAEVNNLPHAVPNDASAQGMCFCYTNAGFTLSFVAIANTSSARFFNGQTGAGVTNATLSGVTAHVSFSYLATS